MGCKLEPKCITCGVEKSWEIGPGSYEPIGWLCNKDAKKYKQYLKSTWGDKYRE